MPHDLTIHLQRELRSDHAGETGAVFIYKGIVAIAKWRGDAEMISFAKAHGVTEADHLNQNERWLPPSQRSRLLGPWRLTGRLALVLLLQWFWHVASKNWSEIQTGERSGSKI